MRHLALLVAFAALLLINGSVEARSAGAHRQHRIYTPHKRAGMHSMLRGGHHRA